ncbi:hypothetical protein A3N99_02660 [Mycobacteroides abscessus]|uniref:hypothetical protein n=1 Tax=Mycobacteroides abscessus TaxID=36809 RepID=UPI00078B72CA|nr:hypothetical protein [Mycobacteroides abscessus]AMU39214.1 hypothetical protein A3N99_02660 [Mycobacteroides abscessus]
MSINIPEGYELHYAIRQPDGQLVTDGFTNRPVVFADRSGAEKALNQMRQFASRMGITEYMGRIVYRLCSSYIDLDDPATGLIDELEAWRKGQGGQG